MQLFGSRSGSVVGVDIGTQSIKLVELGGSMSAPKVLAWGSEPLPEGAFKDNTLAGPEVVSEKLHKLLSQTGAKSEDMAVAISSSHAITKTISMPKGMDDLEMEEQISIEATHFIPYPLDEVNIDFQIVGPSSTNNDEDDVLLVACRRAIVEDYVDLIEDSGLSIKYVDIDTYALERTFRSRGWRESSDLPVAVFDIGMNSSHLVAMDKNGVLYSRHQNFGASQLIKLIRREYSVNSAEAEEILRSAQPPEDFASMVQQPYVEMLQQEINRALQFFYSSSAFSNVSAIFLTGGSAPIAGLASDLESSLGLSVSLLNPIEYSAGCVNRERAEQNGARLAVAYGLSLRGLK